MTPEEKLAEKLRLQREQEESQLEFAVDMMGIKDVPPSESNSNHLAINCLYDGN